MLRPPFPLQAPNPQEAFKQSMLQAHAARDPSFIGLLSNQGKTGINFCFIMVPLRKKVLKYGTPKPSSFFVQSNGSGLPGTQDLESRGVGFESVRLLSTMLKRLYNYAKPKL